MELIRQLLIICLLTGFAGQQAQAERPLEQHLGATVDSVPEGITQPELQELVSIVFQEGHQVDFGLLCVALNIQHMFYDCHFPQISVRLPSGKADVLSFNVPDKGSLGVALIIVCHTSQDVNEIFVVSMSASLSQVFVAGLDGRFAETDVQSVQNNFTVDMAYWARNLNRVYDDLGLQKPPHRRLPLGRKKEQSMFRYRSTALLTAGLFFVAVQAAAQNGVPVKIVGIGATSCARFTTEIAANSDAEKSYLAWMQGYMSGIMVGRPAGVDEGIDLAPYTYPLAAQAAFLREFCAKQPKSDFADGVEQLYVRLKKLNGT